VLLTALPGIGDILPPGLVSPGVQAFLKQWLPSSLSGYRDAFVFVALILVLLFRPNGILGKRGRDEL
jgi:branched-chain amino acid transport system permease protein